MEHSNDFKKIVHQGPINLRSHSQAGILPDTSKSWEFLVANIKFPLQDIEAEHHRGRAETSPFC